MDYFHNVFPIILELKCVSCVAANRWVRNFSDLICVLKMNKGITCLERHEGE